MKEPVIIVWGVLTIAAGFWLKWCMKRYGRQFDGSTPIHILVFALFSSIVGVALQLTMKESIHSVWVVRLASWSLASFKSGVCTGRRW